MAKMLEEMIIVKVSKMVRDDAGDFPAVFGEEVCSALEEAISDMVGKGHLVEIIKSDDD